MNWFKNSKSAWIQLHVNQKFDDYTQTSIRKVAEVSRNETQVSFAYNALQVLCGSGRSLDLLHFFYNAIIDIITFIWFEEMHNFLQAKLQIYLRNLGSLYLLS